MEWEPESLVQIDRKIFMKSLKTTDEVFARARWDTYEHLRVSLDKVATFDLLLDAASNLAQAKFPVENRHSFDWSDSVGKA